MDTPAANRLRQILSGAVLLNGETCTQEVGRRAKVIAQCTPLRPHGMVSGWWSRCVQAQLPENNLGHSIFYLRDGVGGEVAETRNAIVELVLEYDREAEEVVGLYWIDDDVLAFPGCMLELLHSHKDIVSGVYFTKRPGNLSAPLIYPEKYGGPDRFRPGLIYPVWGHGMGLTLVRTGVYQRMRDELDLGKDKYGHTAWYKTSRVTSERGPVAKPSDAGDLHQTDAGTVETGFTEDMYFLGEARKLGYQPHVNTNRHAFGFHYDAAKDRGYPEKQWKQWVAGECILWDTEDGPVTWD